LTNIEAMKQALEALEKTHTAPGCEQWALERKACITLRTAIAEAEKQKPVAWAVFEGWNAHDLYLPQEYDEALKMAGYKGDHAEVKPLYTTPPAQEFVCSTGLCHYKAKRPWVGLTDEDCKGMNVGDMVVAMWADRILKEKNT